MFNLIIGAASGSRRTGNSPVIMDFIPVVFEISQSNGGQAEADRLALTDQITGAGLTKLTYIKQPLNCRVWNKPIMNNTNDGSMQDLSAGVNGTQYDWARVFGADVALLPLLRNETTENKAYYIKAMSGGTPLYTSAGNDWNASSVNELLDISLNYYATPAINTIIAENPGKEIKVFILRHQGESDDLQVERDAYYQNSLDLLAKIRAYQINGVSYFSDAPFVDVLLHYAYPDTQEGLMNDLKLQFASEQPNCYTIDISNQPRKIDLTTAQKGGYSPTLTDNNHGSYLVQLRKGEAAFDLLRSINWI